MPQMAKQKKQQNQRQIPQNNQKTRTKIRHNIHGKPKHQRNVSKQKMDTKIAKNKPIQTSTNDQMQNKMVRQTIHTNQSILSFQPNMQHLRTPIRRFNNKNVQMDLFNLRNKSPQRHQRSKKHTKRRNKINILNKNKYIL